MYLEFWSWHYMWSRFMLSQESQWAVRCTTEPPLHWRSTAWCSLQCRITLDTRALSAWWSEVDITGQGFSELCFSWCDILHEFSLSSISNWDQSIRTQFEITRSNEFEKKSYNTVTIMISNYFCVAYLKKSMKLISNTIY